MSRRPASLTVALHLAGIATFLAVPLLMAPDADLRHPFRFSLGRSRELLGYSCAIGYFYLNYYRLVPRLYFRRRYGFFALATLAAFAAVTVLPVLCVPFQDGAGGGLPQMPPQGLRPPGPLRHIEHNFFRFAIVFTLSMLLRVSRRWRETEAARRDAELATLKTQLSPHFLFNSLNTVYALAVTRSEEAAPAVARLSGMMRYLMEEAACDTVPLERELDHLRDYIDLQRLRFGHTAALDVQIGAAPAGLQVAPQLLLPFLENAFKHGVNPERPSPVCIRLELDGRTLRLYVQNRKVLAPVAGAARTGLGLAHTRQRLEGLYPGRHQLRVEDTAETFTVTLHLDL